MPAVGTYAEKDGCLAARGRAAADFLDKPLSKQLASSALTDVRVRPVTRATSARLTSLRS